MVSSSHSSSRGPLRPPFLLSVLNEHMLQISRGREEGKRGRKSKRTDTREGNFRDCCEVGGMSALLTSHGLKTTARWPQAATPGSRAAAASCEPSDILYMCYRSRRSSFLSPLHLFVLVELMQHIWLARSFMRQRSNETFLRSRAEKAFTGT